jgi:hypothetical protein
MNPDLCVTVVEKISGAWKFDVKPVLQEMKFTNKRFHACGETFAMQCFRKDIAEIKAYFLEKIIKELSARGYSPSETTSVMEAFK